jgi:pentafunctional AROM polypeptide
MAAAHDTPLIAINMGISGKLSRIWNGFMTPVSHPALPFKAAPGQLSAVEIQQALSLHGEIRPKQFYLFGTPIASSRSPALHNTLFQQNGLPHEYFRLETDKVEDVKEIIRALDFGGASVTIPLKLDIIPLLDDITDSARFIGAVNTIIAVSTLANQPPRIIGDNTDWMGMTYSLTSVSSTTMSSNSPGSALIIGGGGTARSAIYALQSLGHSPLYIVSRTPSKLATMVSSFPKEFNIQPLITAEQAAEIKDVPSVAIGTIPADKPIEQNMREILAMILRHPEADTKQQRTYLEMAMRPSQTALMLMAKDAGWFTIPGLEVLSAQGWYQVSILALLLVLLLLGHPY